MALKSWFLSVYPASLPAMTPPAPARTEWRLKTRMDQLKCIYIQSLSRVWFFASSWIVACQGSSVYGISQARMEWTVISSSRASSWPRDWAHVSFFSCSGRQILYHCLTWEVYWNVYTVAQMVKNKTKGILVFTGVTLEFWSPYFHWKCSWGRHEMFKFAG